MAMIKYLVTGTGRCGTTYITNIFNSINIKSGHESVFMSDRNDLNTNNLLESSWLATPFLNENFFENVKVIHIVRNPEKTIASFKNIGFFDIESPYLDFAYKHLSDLFFVEHGLKAAYFYVKWNKMIIEKCKNKEYYFHRIEDDIEELLDKLNIKVDKAIENRFYDNPLNETRFEIDSIQDEKLKKELLSLKKKFGYKD